MTAFRSRWDDWEPKEAPLRTDKADKSHSVSSVSDTPRRLDETEGASVSSVSSSPGPFTAGIDPSDPKTGPRRTPAPLTDRTDKSTPQAFNLTPDKADRGPLPERVVLLHCPPGVPETWTQGVADLLAMPCLASCPPERWQTLREDAYCFLRDWGARAHGLGWTMLDLFGVHPEKPWARYDHMGLVKLLDGGRVTALSDTEAMIEKPSGSRVTFRRRGQVNSEAQPVWSLK